jgi:pyruvate dehydrogenase E1 component
MGPMATTSPRADLAVLESIQRRVLWLASLSVHHANTRPNPDGTKIGGHQPSYPPWSAS